MGAKKGAPSNRRILSEELIVEVIANVGKTCFLDTAFAMAGVSASGWKTWLREGRRSLGKRRKAEERGEEYVPATQHLVLCESLLEQVKIAQSTSEEKLLSKIEGSPQWQAAAWILQRKNAKYYDNSRELRELQQQVKELTATVRALAGASGTGDPQQ